jgi:catechol 2,3-dioxygenase-like lactoylglutathione lyase family enzyme
MILRPKRYSANLAVLLLLLALQHAAAQQAVRATITDQGWQEVVVSVTDLDRTARFFISIGGYEEKWRGPLQPTELAFWGLDREATGAALLIGPPGQDTGLVRLVQFESAGRQKPTRPGARAWDTGCFFSLLVHVNGMQSIYDEAVAMGWWTETPVTRLVSGHTGQDVVIFRGPDGVQVQGVELSGSSPDGKRLSGPFSILQTVRDRDEAFRFFTQVLGFETHTNDEPYAAEEPVYSPFGIPRNLATSVRLSASSVYTHTAENGRMDVIEIPDLEGRDHASLCAAPNLGILAARYPVASTKDALYDIAERGGRIELFASGVEIQPYGSVRLFSVKTPDGANVHFYEKLDRINDLIESGARAHGL